MREIKFIWVCRNIHFNRIERVELTDTMLLSRSFPSWIITPNCELIAKILPSGIKDKSGKEIWESDCLNVWLDGIGNETFEVRWDSSKARFMLIDKLGDTWSFDDSNDIEVIGNIYENPELLKVKA